MATAPQPAKKSYFFEKATKISGTQSKVLGREIQIQLRNTQKT